MLKEAIEFKIRLYLSGPMYKMRQTGSQKMKMLAAVLRETGAKRPYATSQPVQIEEVELSPPQAGELMVKIAGGGLCHSDLSVINGNRPRPMPLVLGH